MSQRNYTRSIRCKSIKGSYYTIPSDDFLFRFKQDHITWSTLSKMAKMNDMILINKIKTDFSERVLINKKRLKAMRKDSITMLKGQSLTMNVTDNLNQSIAMAEM